MRILMLAGAFVLLLAVQAQADEKFTQMDKDGDGRVSWEEFQAAYSNMKRPAFDAVDTDKDGWISHEEWDSFRAAHAGARSSGGMGGGQMPPKSQPNEGGEKQLPLIRPPKQ